MSAATITPPPAQLPVAVSGSPTPPPSHPHTPYRWTLEAYRELYKTGLFTDKKIMLLHGEIYVMAPPNPPHNLSLGLTEDWLKLVFAIGHHVRIQMGFDVGTENDPSPDLAVVVGTRRDYPNRQATTAVLVVEVSDSTLFTYTTTKAELYATAKVPEYWVIDIPHRQLHVFTDPVELPAGLGTTAYRKHIIHAENDSISPTAAPTATIRVAELLP